MLEDRASKLEVERDYLKFQNDKLRRLLFGHRSEKLPARDDGLEQLDLFREAETEVQDAEFEEAEETETRKRRRSKRRPIPKEIHREQVEVDVDPELRVCPDCDEAMTCFGHDTSEDLEYVPALFYVIEYLLKKYACKKCQSGVVQAKRPPRPIPRAKPGAGLLAYILVSKYQDHLPLNRLERIFGRHGMAISRKTLCDWVGRMAELLRPIVETMKRQLLEATLLQADETTLKVKNPEVKGKTSTAYIWTYGIPNVEVVFDFTMGRSGDGPKKFFDGKYPPYLQSDGYSVYKSMDQCGLTVSVGCWAHARRKFFEARAEQPDFAKLVLAAIQKLFRIERKAGEKQIRGKELVELRQKEALPIIETIREFLEAKKPHVVRESGLGDAIKYALNNFEALRRYVAVPEAHISNNIAEGSLRGLVIGRKNWMFVGHPAAGPRAATILSLIETCKRLGVEPYRYLKGVIAELAVNPTRVPEELTPRAWRDRAEAEKAAERAGG